MSTAQPRILGIFAHPDDETFCAGGTFARYAKDGAEIMVVSATRGQAGQIRDARVATRRTIAAVREAELRDACRHLGVHHVRCLDHRDGELADVDRAGLVHEVADLVRDFRPEVVVTFGADGGYGHPDHVAISEATTEACLLAWDHDVGPAPRRLYHSYFPRRGILLMERIANWLTSRGDRRAGSLDFVYALLLLAEQTSTMRFVQDHSEIRWYPPGSYVVEQGEASNELFLILSGAADVIEESTPGVTRKLSRLGPGEFFGERGISGHRTRSAHVVAAEPLSCFALTATEPEKFTGRGVGAAITASARPTRPEEDSAATACIDVGDFVDAKINALSAYRSQFCLEPDMFPADVLRELYGTEYFVQVLPARQLERGLWGES